MKKVILSLALIGALLSLARANETAPVPAATPTPTAPRYEGVETRDWNYIFRAERFVPGHSIKLLQRGLPLGEFEGKAMPEKPTADAKTVDLIAEALALRNAANKTITAAIKDVQARPLPRNEQSVQPVVSAQAVAKLKVEELDWTKFRDCAVKTLPRLKLALRAAIDGNIDAKQAVKEEIDLERGDGDDVQLFGVACGKYLGKAGAVHPSLSEQKRLVEDIKFLSALSVRSGEEAKLLLRAFVASRNKTGSDDARELGLYYWKKLSLLGALGSAPLPSIESLRDALKAELAALAVDTSAAGGTLALRLSFDTSKIAPATEEVLAYAKELVK